jgi:4-hydroxybenzoate polyprenyltransferase
MIAPLLRPARTVAATVRALWLLTRPRLVPWVMLLPLVGFGFAHWDHALDLQNGPAMLLLLLAWCLLHAGTMWLNAALDPGQGEVLYGRPVPVPPYVRLWAMLALAACVALATWAQVATGLVAAACAILAVLYSHPRTAWKGRPLLGPLTNVAGYGVLSPLAGWSLVGVPFTLRFGVTLGLLASWILGAYFAAQSFQQEDDRAAGHRTLVATAGPRTVLRAARLSCDFGALGVAVLCAIGWYPRICLVFVPFAWALDRWLRRWMAQPGGGDEAWARGLARRGVTLAIVLVGSAAGAYLGDFAHGGPVCGLATAAGHPPAVDSLPLEK